MTSNETIRTILSRQTIREYKQEQLPDEMLDAILACAKSSPSGRNSQPCHLRILQDAKMLHEMHIDFKNYVGWDTPVHTRCETNPFYHNAPTFAVIFSENDSAMDSGIMTQNICIAAESLGLSTCIVASVGALFQSPNADKWKERLNVPKHYKFQIGICIGFPDEKPEPKPRFDDRILVLR